MVTQSQKEKFQTLMRGTILSLCQNVLEHKSEIKVEVFIGITLDRKQDFHFSVVETLHADTVSGSTEVTPTRAPEPQTHVSPPANSNRAASSMLERLMTQDMTPQSTSHRDTGITPSQKGREVTSSTVGNSRADSASLSYSELLRSFGEMSRQDHNASAPHNHNASTSQSVANTCPTLYNAINSNTSRHSDSGTVNQAQVVIPINFEIHSPSGHSSHPSSQRIPAPQQYNDRISQRYEERPQSHKRETEQDQALRYARPPVDREIHADSTFASPSSSTFNPYDVKVKQEMASDDEGEQQSDSFSVPQRPRSPLISGELSTQLLSKEYTSSVSADSSASSKGILMSLLCEKPSEQGKRRGRPKRPPEASDPPYQPGHASQMLHLPQRDPSPRKDSRVLIGLTDYISGFKEGDAAQNKRCVFAGDDIRAKMRQVILLNSGAFSTVRMVHRNLQGLRAGETDEIMHDMTLPRDHPHYVGEYKIVVIRKPSGGKRGELKVGVFFKIPPELVNPAALVKFDIDFEDYTKFYNQVFRYDRLPQPHYFEAIENLSPFYGIFGGERGWKEECLVDSSYTPHTTSLRGTVHQDNVSMNDNSQVDSTADQDSGHGLLASNVKSEKSEWGSLFSGPEAKRPRVSPDNTDAPSGLAAMGSPQASMSSSDSDQVTGAIDIRSFPVDYVNNLEKRTPDTNNQDSQDSPDFTPNAPDQSDYTANSSQNYGPPVFPGSGQPVFPESRAPVFPEPIVFPHPEPPVFPQPYAMPDDDQNVDDT